MWRMDRLKRRLQEHAIRFFKDIGQGFFIENAYFGFALWALFLAFDRRLFICGSVAAFIAYLHSARYSTPRLLRDRGLITLNGFFFGIAMGSLFELRPPLFAFLVFGALFVPFATKAVFEVLQHWKLSPLILPYILTVWGIWLCAHGSAFPLTAHSWPDTIPYLPSLHPAWKWAARIGMASLLAIGRLVFLPNAAFGASVLALVSLFSPKRGLYFALGTIMATAIACLIDVGGAWEHGYLSYSSGLIGLGLASLPERFSPLRIFFFCAFSALLTLSVQRFMTAQQLPALSLPYVLTFWLAGLSRVPRVNLNWAPASLALVAAAALGGAALAPAQAAESLQPAATLTWASKYMTDGFNIGGDRPVMEPSVSLGWKETGLTAMIWSALQTDRDHQELDELDFMLLYSHPVFTGSAYEIDLHGYLDYWFYPHVGNIPDIYGNSVPGQTLRGDKINAGLSFPKWLSIADSPLVPSYNLYYWLYWADNQLTRYEGGAHHELMLQYWRNVPRVVPGSLWQSVGISGSINYNDGAFNVAPGWSHSVLELNSSVGALGGTFMIALDRQWSYEPSVDPHDELWSTLSYTKVF